MKLIKNINENNKKRKDKINNKSDNKINEIRKIENKKKIKAEVKKETISKILMSILALVMHNLLFNCVYAAFDINVFIDNYVIKVLMFIIFVFLIIFAVKIYKMSKEEKKYTLEEMKELKKQNMVRGFEEIEKGKEINKDGKIDEGKKNIHEIILKNDNFVESSILEKKKELEELKEKENLKNDKKKRKKKKKVQKRRDFIPTDSVIIKSKEEISEEEVNASKEDRSNNVSNILNDMGNNKKFEIQLDEEPEMETELKENDKHKDNKKEHNDMYNLISNKKKEKDELNEKISNMMFGVQNDYIHNELDDIIYNYKKRNLKTKIDTKQKAKTQEARINLNGMINKIVELNEQKDEIEENGISKEVTFEEIGREFQNELGENTKIILEEHKSNNN